MTNPAIQFARRHRVASAAAVAAGSLLLLTVAGFTVLNFNPGLAAQGADALRGVIGDENVARLETLVLGWQDTLQSWVYHARGDQPQAPWASPVPPDNPTAVSLADTATSQAPTSNGTPPPIAAATPTPQFNPVLITPTAAPGASPTSGPAPLKPMGHLPGEGAWSVYLTDSAGQPVAFRTFLGPDPQRDYALAAVVAFDLTAARLHFVLGSQEPASPVKIDRPGRIPPKDLQSGSVLAAFNGGFKARHGQFGAMVDGVLVLAPRTGFGTVAMFDDGRVAIGAWGTDIFYAQGLRNWRQNGPLIVQNGQINPHTADTAPEDWGYTVRGATATWRSALGISGDRQTLYYVAGPYLTLPVLAKAVADTGAANAIQLDINGYWVVLDAIKSSGGGFQSEPLMDGMKNDDRYINSFDRDFFYVTANAN